MNSDEALEFVSTHGVVLASAKGAVPKMSEVIAGEPIKGSWWGHPRGKQIFAVLSALQESPDVLGCRSVDGKVTLVHRRLWPARIRVADRLPRDWLARVEQVHTPDGHHESLETPFPNWADAASVTRAATLSEREAFDQLGAWTAVYRPRGRG